MIVQRFLLLCAVMVGLTGCATVKNGRYQMVEVTSNPAGADVTIACGMEPQAAVVTPATIRISRRAQPCTLTVNSDGHQPQTVSFERKTSRLFWYNLLW